MTRSARVLLSVLLVLAVPGGAAAVNTDFQARNGIRPVPNATFTFQGDGETKTVKTDASGRATVDLKPNVRYQVNQEDGRFWPKSRTIMTPSDAAGRPITFQTDPISGVHLWSPPPGVFTVGAMLQSLVVGDMRRTKDTRTDRPTQANLGPFVDRADARELHQRNDDTHNRFSVGMAGVYGAFGLPVGPLGDCECMSFSHAIGLGGGYSQVNLDTDSRSDQRAFGTELRGEGGFYNFDYTFTAMQRPTDKWYSRFGTRFNFTYMGGVADMNRFPKGSDGLSALNARSTSESDTELNWHSWSTSLDLLYRICDCLALFLGLKYREVSATVNSGNPSQVAGILEVQRIIDQRYFNRDLLPRFGAEAYLGRLFSLPAFLRVEGEYGPGGWGGMVKAGVGFDALPALRDRF